MDVAGYGAHIPGHASKQRAVCKRIRPRFNNLERCMVPDGDLLLDGDRKEIHAKLGAEQVVMASLEFAKVEEAACPEFKDDGDPFNMCPCCSSMDHRSELKDGTPVPTVPLSICMDAINGANRFALAGRSQQEVKPSTSTYIGKLANEVFADFKSGKLKSQAMERAAAAGVDGDSSENTLLPTCTTALVADRTKAVARGDLDIYGVTAGCCTHAIPGLGLVVLNYVPECHFFYDKISIAVAIARADTKRWYLDLACRYAPSFNLNMAELVEQGHLATCSGMRILVPWMHGFDHDVSCQYKHSGLYAEGAGRRVGEQTEHLWSVTKPFTKRGRYATKAHWVDGLNNLFRRLSLRKQVDFPKLLEGKLKRLPKTEAQCRADLEVVKKDAAQHGVTDVVAAAAAVDTIENAPERRLSTKAQYVEALMKWWSQTGVASDTAALSLVLHGSSGINLLRTAASEKSRVLLETRLARLAQELDQPLGEHWTKDSPQYTAALPEVKGHAIQHYRSMIEEQVFKRKLLKDNLQQVDSGNNAKKLKQSMETARKNIQGYLEMLAAWEVEGTTHVRVPVTQVDVDKACSGELPWLGSSAGLVNGSVAAQVYYGRQYKLRKAQLDRTLEEKLILSKEVVRTFNWLEWRIEYFTERKNTLAARGGKCAVDAAAAIDQGEMPEAVRQHLQSALSFGESALAARELARFKLIMADATDRLGEYLPPPPPTGVSAPSASAAAP